MKALPLLLALFFLSTLLHAQDQQKLLEHAYKTHSKKELKQFFDNWHKEIPPISDSEFAKLSDLQKETYKVFIAFFKPDNYGSYKVDKYAIIKNSIKIYQFKQIWKTYKDSESVIVNYINADVENDSLRQSYLMREKNGHLSPKTLDIFRDEYVAKHSSLIDSIMNFRPSLDDQRIPIYLIDNYDSILNNFMGEAIAGLIIDNKLAPGDKKEKFLEKFVTISTTPFLGDNYVLCTYPIADMIIFDKDFTTAQIEFTTFRRGGSTVLKKEWNLEDCFFNID